MKEEEQIQKANSNLPAKPWHFYQSIEKKIDKREEQGTNHTLTEAKPSESAELKIEENGQWLKEQNYMQFVFNTQ